MPLGRDRASARFVSKRHRGQNFLIDKNILRKIIAAAELNGTETVVEVGAGKGTLTKELAAHAMRVIAVELDRELFTVLEKQCAALENVSLIQDDIRDVEHTVFGTKDGEYDVVANIPYNITSHLIRSFLEQSPRPRRMILLIQKEVAERMCVSAAPHSLLELSVRYFADCRILFPVSRHCFSPKPKVESAVVEIQLHDKKPSTPHQAAFFRVVKAGFAQKRKKLLSNLATGLSIPPDRIRELFASLEISENVRAEELSLEDWRALSLKMPL